MNSSATSAVLPVRTVADHSVRFSKPVLSFDQARELSRQYGTPTIVISKSTLTNTYQTMKAELPNVEMFYAAKANSDVSILRPLFQAGSSVDVCSYRELQSALLAGFSPDQMIHTHPCKTIQNLMDCYNEGVRWFTVDCSGEIDKLVRYTPDVNVILRLAAASTSSLINLSAKFGCDPVDAPALAAEAGRKGLKVRCLSFHVGSQCLNP